LIFHRSFARRLVRVNATVLMMVSLIACGEVRRQPTQSASLDTAPPTGQIAFVSTQNGHDEIHVINADGSGEHVLINLGMRDEDPAWSPDGKQIAFDSYQGGKRSIYIANADGSNMRQLVGNATNDLYPVWSPEGKQIAFRSHVPARA